MQTENQTAHQTAMTMEVTRNGAGRSGRPSFGRRLDPCNPRSWSGQPLRYSLHARNRCEEREIPEIVYLPADSRLADVDMSNSQVEAVTFKVPRGDDSFFMVLNIDGCVVTVYRKDEAFGASHRRKQRRRELLALAA